MFDGGVSRSVSFTLALTFWNRRVAAASARDVCSDPDAAYLH